MAKKPTMKEIKLKQIIKISNTHQVYLGNGTANKYLSKREANYFLAATNIFLTDKLHELHVQYVDVWNAYQENWFYLGNNRQSNKTYLYEVERALGNHLEDIKNLFDHSVNRCGYTNGNFIVFINFTKVTHLLEATIRLLAELFGKHSNTNGISKMDIYLKRVFYARSEIENYGKRSTTRYFKIPTHISEDKSYIPELVELQVA